MILPPDMGEIAAYTTIPLYANVAALGAPASYAAAIDITSLRRGRAIPGTGGDIVQALPESALLYIRAVSGTVTIPGPVKLLAGRSSELYEADLLKAGATSIVVAALGGHPERIYLGADWERLAIVAAGALAGGNVTIDLVAEVRF